MKFRTKTVLGVALIEAVLLAVLVLSVLDRLRSSNEAQIEQRAAVTGRLLAAAARDPLIAYDVSSLASLGADMVASNEVAYITFLDDGGRVMEQAGPARLLGRRFAPDTGMATVADEVLDREVTVEAANRVYGRARFGIHVGALAEVLSQTRRWAISISLVEMALVAMFSLLLGSFLTRRLSELREASHQIASGNLSHRLSEQGGDELAETAHAFNLMSDRLESERRAREAAMEEIRQLASFQHAVLEASDSAILVTDRDGMLIHFNPAAETLLGYRAGDVVGRMKPDRFHEPAELAAHAPAVAEALGIATPQGADILFALPRHGLSERQEWTWTAADGRRFPVFLSVSGVYAEDGSLLGFMGVAQDISALRRADERMREAAKVFEASPEGIVVTDADGAIRAVNPAFSRITGYTAEEVAGKNPRILKSGRHDVVFYRALWQSLSDTGHWEGEIWNRRRNGDVFPVWQSISAVRNGQGDIVEYVAMFSDISRRREAEEELRYRAWHDALTGLPNRGLLDEHLQLALREARRSGTKVAVIFMDLDYFKTVNDTLGHATGDILLCQAAERLGSCVRDIDTLARQGGDEFVVVLQGIRHAQDAARVAAKLIDAMDQPFDLNGQRAHISASAGITLYPDDGGDTQSLYRNADLAMYRAKSAGRNNFQFYEPSMTEKAIRRRELEIELRHALAADQGQLEVHYQPIIDLGSGRLAGAEALLRWQHPDRGAVAPAKFIPLAEETGLINPLGRWVLERVCRDGAGLAAAGHPLTVSVNLSSRQVHNGLAIEELARMLARHGLPGSALAFEITEGLLLADAESTRVWLNSARELGIRIDLDDFGTGYSSLAYLKRFPIDRVKIDRSFVHDMMADPDSLTLIETILAMARGLRLEVVAEGIELDGQRESLRALGCRYGQGYLLGKPMPLAELTALFRL
jgi:diguanylate cyclase (GGDEF)-like protein/PAS domain S-box-containing protein